MLKGENLVVFGEIQGIPCYFRAQVPYARVNSLYTSSICRYPLQTVWTWIRPDKMLVLIWIKLHDTLMIFLKDFFQMLYEEIDRQQRSMHGQQGMGPVIPM